MAGLPPPHIQFPSDEGDLDDAELWAVIDSAAACNSRPSRKTLLPPPKTPTRIPSSPNGEVVLPEEQRMLGAPHRRPHKMARFVDPGGGGDPSRLMVVRRPLQAAAPTPMDRTVAQTQQNSWMGEWREGDARHSLSGQFPSVSMFKQYQNSAMAILEKSDYSMIGGHPFIKKSGWRKIAFFFNLSIEIKDKTIEYDENRNVLRAEFIVRAIMQGGRFADGWGSCERREKRFIKPNHDIPSTAETRAKNKACQDLLGIGEYRPGIGNMVP